MLITYQSGDNQNMVEYLMVRKPDCCLVKNVRVISSEESDPQNRNVIGRLVIPMKPQEKIIDKFVPRPKVWKLKDEVLARFFTREMAARNDDVNQAKDVRRSGF